jgi:CDP-4-dehydro-6-deoxyglucose reductase
LIPNGELSSWLTVGDRIGEPVDIEGPYGIFRLRDADVPIIFIAGGSGMAPIKAMLEQGGVSSNRPIVYLYGGRTQADLYDNDVIDPLIKSWSGSTRFLPILSEEPQDSDWVGARGLVTDFIKSISEFEVAEAQAYLCGPPLMIDAAIPILTGAGMRGRDIYFDKFTESSSTR